MDKVQEQMPCKGFGGRSHFWKFIRIIRQNIAMFSGF